MAFQANDRVRVTAQNSQWRGHYGTVLSVDAEGNNVRLDGMAKTRTVLLLDNELQTSTQPDPVTY